MPGQRLRLFLSSTVEDLKPFRDAVLHVGQRLGFEVIAMEDFGPDPRAAVALCREKVESADLFVGLYAHRYGFVPDGFDGTSMTELEYDWAKACRPAPPVLLFLLDENIAWPPKLIEHGPGWDRLQSFKAKLRRHHVVAPLTTLDQLRDDLFVHLPNFLVQTKPAPESVVPTLPRPPEPCIVHQYTLLQTKQVVGRAQELDRLDNWLDNADAHVLCVVAIGGMGKSALTWRWFHERAISPGLAGRFWWSFYETDASFDRFVVTALAYCTGQSVAAVEALPSLDREQQLLAILDRKPFLLVLDGMERLLIAYSSLNFAHLSDDDLDRETENAVADHLGLPEGFVGRHRLRKTIDRRVGEFLRKLSRIRAARVLLTTRLFPSELQTDTGHALPGSEAWFLTGLEPADALALWRELGVSGDDPQLSALFARIDHYPLLIRALAGEVANYRPAPGNFTRWRHEHPDFNPFTLPLVQARSHVLANSIGDLAVDSSEVLQTVAAFRAPVDYATVTALFVTRRTWTARRLDSVLTDLEDRGLLGWDRAANTYDMHPIVRGVVWTGLGDVRQRAVYGALEEHFSAVPEPSGDWISLADAHKLIELFTALVGLDRHADAANLYFERLVRFKFFEYGMRHVNIALLESLFCNGLEVEPATGDSIDRVLAHLSYNYEGVGRLSEAYAMGMRSLDVSTEFMRSVRLDLMTECVFQLGKVKEALCMTRAAEQLKDRDLGEFHSASRAVWEAKIGDTALALRIISRLSAGEHFQPGSYEASIRLLRGEFDAVIALETAVQADARNRVSMTMTGAEARIRLGRAAEVIDFLLDCLRRARSQATVVHELDCLLLLAEAHLRLGEQGTALEYLEDLAEPAARSGCRFIRAKAAVVLTEVERDRGNRSAAITAAEEAYRLAWCDGPPYTYYWTLKRAEELLGELGGAIPQVLNPVRGVDGPAG